MTCSTPSSPKNLPIKFKDWTIPGPSVPGDSEKARAELASDESLDVISGRFRIFQLRSGHKFSTDDLLVAWYGTSGAGFVRTALDLGSGLGTVAMIAAWRLPAAKFVTVEAQKLSYEMALRSIRYNGLESRFEARLGDFRNEDVFSESEKFDLVFGSPPYFPLDAGLKSEHPQRLACRFETKGDVSDYIRVASQRLSPAGMFALVFPVAPAHQRERVLEAAKLNGLVVIRTRDVIMKEGEPPLLGLFLMMRMGDLPAHASERTFHENPLIIRRADGSVHPEYVVIKQSIGFPPG